MYLVITVLIRENNEKIKPGEYFYKNIFKYSSVKNML